MNEKQKSQVTAINEKESDKVFDLAVIGAGPAGLTAGLYAARAGLDVVVFERLAVGGQLAQTEQVENYPGFPEGVNGFDLAFSMKQQADRFGVRTISEDVVSVDLNRRLKCLTTAFGEYFAHNVIVASGARPRKLGLEREDELQGCGVSYCATCDGNFFRGKRVMVVGGGNTAVADAIYLSRICEKVYLVHRRDKLRATDIYHKRVENLPNLEFVWSAVPNTLTSTDGALSSVSVEMLKTKEIRDIEVSALFVAIGTRPNTEFLDGALELDAAGYIVADESGITNISGVYAAGDVRTKFLRQVATAVADGAICAEKVSEYGTI